ncbi:conjugal transfer protein TraD [Nevskia ramosa]|uniref:conjugal transfer protein TraD n=1 Tax=Nevskia ramosa TaxID=64002 RepID=UPI002357F3D9|nr:conjugal transfer protein TraD [Nevskia ramosa]
MDTNDAWYRSRLAYLRGLRRPSKEQRQLLDLIDKGELDSEERRKSDALWAVERAAARLEDAKVKSRSLIYREKVSARKERSHKLIQLGLLVNKADMHLDHGLALGALLECAERLRQPGGQALADRWKTAGDQAIAEWERSTAGLAKLPGMVKVGG